MHPSNLRECTRLQLPDLPSNHAYDPLSSYVFPRERLA